MYVLCYNLVMSLSAITAIADNDMNLDNPGTEFSARVQGADALVTRMLDIDVAAISRGSTDIKDDNHMFNKAVEIWCVTKTWLQANTSNTPDGIPDWTLMAMCQL